MSFVKTDAEMAAEFARLISKADFKLSGLQIIEAHKCFVWFNRICKMIEDDLNGQKSKPEPNGRTRRARRSPSRGDGGDLGVGDQGGSESDPEPSSSDGL